MNHQEVWQQETAQSTKEQKWLSWVKASEKSLGHSIDGDEWKDGYSLDGAFDYFNRGFKSSEYVAYVKIEKKRIKAAKFDNGNRGGTRHGDISYSDADTGL